MRKMKLIGKRCYDHLGGKLGAELFDCLTKQEWIEKADGTAYRMTERGRRGLAELGLELSEEKTDKEK